MQSTGNTPRRDVRQERTPREGRTHRPVRGRPEPRVDVQSEISRIEAEHQAREQRIQQAPNVVRHITQEIS